MRAPDRVVRQAMQLGPNVGHFAEQLLAGTFPWSKLRQGQKLLRLADRYTPERVDAACARALGFDLLEVRRVERILVLALEHEGQPAPPADQRVKPLPAGRFARPGTAFDHRYQPVVTRSTTRYLAGSNFSLATAAARHALNTVLIHTWRMPSWPARCSARALAP